MARVSNQDLELTYSMYDPSNPSWAYGSRRSAGHDYSGSVDSYVPEDDPIRTARDHWVVRQTVVSDSSEIIDSIDVDMIDASEEINAAEIYLVIDTNILINHLLVLKQALSRINADTSRLNVVMLVPGIVVSELDYQKNSARGVANESRKASSWLASEIGNESSRIRGQAYTQTMLPSGDWRQRSGLSNDELILDCCKYFAHVKRKDVLLCTADNNLAVQAFGNAMHLFVRGNLGVIRPPKLWDSEQLLDCVVPGSSKSTASSAHAYGQSRTTRGKLNVNPPYMFSTPTPYSDPSAEDHGSMEIDTDDGQAMLSNMSQNVPPEDDRDILHRQMIEDLGQRLRELTGKLARLQQYRREHESMYSPSNATFSGEIPSESDWSRAWCLRDCLRFVAKVAPAQRRSWSFGDGEASSLADFLGMPGEKGARPGREWAKHDWGRELLVVKKLAKDFEFEDLDDSKMAEYEYAVAEVFATY